MNTVTHEQTSNSRIPIARRSQKPLVQRKCGCGGRCVKCQAKAPANQDAPFLQAKLKVGPPDDEYEREADRVADQVMRMPDPTLQRQEIEEEEETVQRKPIARQITPLVQRQPMEEEEEEMLQTKSTGVNTPKVTPAIQAHIASSLGGGQPLSAAAKAYFQPRFGTNLSDVRIHSGRETTAVAQEINARAFTVGQDIFLGSNAPLLEQRRLLAHELVHCLQQRRTSRTVQRRTATPIRSDKTKTFTYPLKIYTVDQESYAQAQAAANRLNGFEGMVYDYQTNLDYTVKFAVAVFAPPEPDILEKEFGIRLRYKYGKKRLKKNAYQQAAQRWWLLLLKRQGNVGNLFLGSNQPASETKTYLFDEARAADQRKKAQIYGNYKHSKKDEAAKDFLRKELHKLEEDNNAEMKLKERFANPYAVEGSRGTTYLGKVVQMRLRPRGNNRGTAEYNHNIVIHEFMHLMGLGFDHETLETSIMSYPLLNQDKFEQKLHLPEQADVDALYLDNRPSNVSID